MAGIRWSSKKICSSSSPGSTKRVAAALQLAGTYRCVVLGITYNAGVSNNGVVAVKLHVTQECQHQDILSITKDMLLGS